MPRGRVMFGMARDVLRTIAISTGTSWSISNNQLTMVKDSEADAGRGNRAELPHRHDRTADPDH
jgi:hypothetical protein